MIDKIFNIKKKKIVITGSNGYLGSFLVKTKEFRMYCNRN